MTLYTITTPTASRMTASLRSAVRQALTWRSTGADTRITDETGQLIDIDAAAAAEHIDSARIAGRVFDAINAAADAWSQI